MEVIKIGERFRVVDEPGSENTPGRFTFEQQTTDATGRKKWDVCQSERGGMLTLPYRLVLEMVRVLEGIEGVLKKDLQGRLQSKGERQELEQPQAVEKKEERGEKPAPAMAPRPVTLRRISTHGVL